MIVITAAEDGDGIGRIRLRRILDGSAETMSAFIDEVVEPGSVITANIGANFQRVVEIVDGLPVVVALRFTSLK